MSVLYYFLWYLLSWARSYRMRREHGGGSRLFAGKMPDYSLPFWKMMMEFHRKIQALRSFLTDLLRLVFHLSSTNFMDVEQCCMDQNTRNAYRRSRWGTFPSFCVRAHSSLPLFTLTSPSHPLWNLVTFVPLSYRVEIDSIICTVYTYHTCPQPTINSSSHSSVQWKHWRDRGDIYRDTMGWSLLASTARKSLRVTNSSVDVNHILNRLPSWHSRSLLTQSYARGPDAVWTFCTY